MSSSGADDDDDGGGGTQIAGVLVASFPVASRKLIAGEDGSQELTAFVTACSLAFNAGYSARALDLELVSLDREFLPKASSKSSAIIRASFEGRAQDLGADELQRIWNSYSVASVPLDRQEMQTEVVDYWMARMGNHSISQRKRWIVIIYCLISELNGDQSSDRLSKEDLERFHLIAKEAIAFYFAGGSAVRAAHTTPLAQDKNLMAELAGSILSSFAFQACQVLVRQNDDRGEGV